jgi:alginate O-acetyltransferase complex protein AlgI
MHFLSLTWLAWMGGAFSLYWTLPDRWRNHGLVAVTVAFLAVHSWPSLVILAGFTLGLYAATRGETVDGRRTLVIAAVLIGVLAIYKTRIAPGSSDLMGDVRDVAIPLGLSYYTFRCLHYLLERYKNHLPAHTFSEFVGYLLFLPTIVVGPIHRFPDFVRDRRRKRWDGRALYEGGERIVHGFAKIAILGNWLVSDQMARWIAGIGPGNDALVAYLTMVQHGLNLYFQFSGFSDVAIGFARTLGYRVMENFRWPLLQKNISAFWRSWHISLSSWCREYVYRVVLSLTRSPALAAILTLLAIGLWHEISPRYLMWGLYQGIGVVIWQQFQRLKVWLPEVRGTVAQHLRDALCTALTVNYFWFGFAIVGQPDFASTLALYRTILLFWW